MSQDEGASDSYCVPCARMPARMMHGTANSNCERLPPTFDSLDCKKVILKNKCQSQISRRTKMTAVGGFPQDITITTTTNERQRASTHIHHAHG
jgi:hypothetical protein